MYKEKYEEAIAYIKNMQKENQIESEEKNKTSTAEIENNLNALCENFLANKRESLAFYEAIDSPIAKTGEMNSPPYQNSAESKVNEFKIYENNETSEAQYDLANKFKMLSNPSKFDNEENNKSNELNFESRNKLAFVENHFISNQDQIITKAYKVRKMQMLEKLKEEYHNLVEDKKNLENKIAEFKLKKKEFSELNIKNENLSLQLDIANEKIKCLTEENKAILERNNKITFENYEITNTNNQLKESLKYLEKERLLNKNKINSNFNKVKLYEKENNASKKKLNNINTNLKNLTEKLNVSVQEKIILEKNMEDLKQEYENKITNLMLEQQKIIKDSFLTTLNSLEEKRIPLEFFYEEEKNSLTIMLEDIVISEFTNLKISKIDKSGKIEEIKTTEDLYQKKAIPIEAEQLNNSIQLENNDIVKSPSNKSSMMNINNKNIFNNNQNVSGSNHKNNKIDLENLLSLNKILSGSSKKSFTNTNTKRILMSNFSSAKKISAFYEENNNNFCTAFYNSTMSEALNKNGNYDFQNFSNYMTNNITNFASTNFSSNMKVIPEEIDRKISLSSIKEGHNLNDGYIQSSSCSKVFNFTINKNNENNTSHYENDRYSGMNFSAKKKSRVSNLMSGKKNNNNFTINENDENANPNIQSHFQCENSIIKINNQKFDNNFSIVKNNILIVEENGNNNETTFLPSIEDSKKLNGRGNNLSLIKKASNNNNFEKCIKNININTEQINSINRDDIKKIINTASSARHRNMISLDEALNIEEICDKDSLDNEAALNSGSFNSNNFIQPNINLAGFNYFSVQGTNEAKNQHFNFNLHHIEKYLSKDKSTEENLINKNYEESKQINKNLSEEPKKDKISKKIEFSTAENYQKIFRKKIENILIENVVTDLLIVATDKKQEKPIEITCYKKSSQDFMIDSNVNLITITSFKKSINNMIASENNFNLISKKDKKFFAEKLKLSQNSVLYISQTSKNFGKEIKKNKLEEQSVIITEEHFCLKEEEKKVNDDNISLKEELKSYKKLFAEKNLEIVNG
jgi:hypothetical protein